LTPPCGALMDESQLRGKEVTRVGRLSVRQGDEADVAASLGAAHV
jgi:hypothetical protein